MHSLDILVVLIVIACWPHPCHQAVLNLLLSPCLLLNPGIRGILTVGRPYCARTRLTLDHQLSFAFFNALRCHRWPQSGRPAIWSTWVSLQQLLTDRILCRLKSFAHCFEACSIILILTNRGPQEEIHGCVWHHVAAQSWRECIHSISPSKSPSYKRVLVWKVAACCQGTH